MGVIERGAVEEFIRSETDLLNQERYEEWLDLLTDDFDYRMPTPVLRDDPAQERYSSKSLLAWESTHSLKLRFQRIFTDFAWADRPPAFHRRHLTAIRVAATDSETEWEVSCDEPVFRSRAPEGTHIVSALRKYKVRVTGESLKLAQRNVFIDIDRPGLGQIALLF